MFNSMSNGLQLAKECWQVLMHDKEMLLYPTFCSVINIGILLIAYYYLLGLGFFAEGVVFNYTNQQWIGAAVIAVVTLYASHFVFSFFECALVASAIKRLRGENPTLFYGIGVAGDRIPQIAGWSFFATLFGILLAMLKSLFKSRWAQKAVGGAIQTGWNVVTVFVLPLIIVENAGAMNAIKQSTTLVKQKWGEAATLEIGFKSLSTIAALPIAFLFGSSQVFQSSNPSLALLMMIAAISLGIILGLVFAALNGIAKAVLYNFALNGNIPDEINESTLGNSVVRDAVLRDDAQSRVQT